MFLFKFFNLQLLLEFSEIIKLPLEDMRQNWLEALPKIQNVQRLSAKNLTADAQTMSVLYHLPKLFSKAKESGKILNCYRVSISMLYLDNTFFVMNLIQFFPY